MDFLVFNRLNFLFLIIKHMMMFGAYTYASKCNEIMTASHGKASSGSYTVTNGNGQEFKVYCQFNDGYGYAFTSKENNVEFNMSSFYDDINHVIIYHKRESGRQYSAKIQQLARYSNITIFVGLNKHDGYQGIQNTLMGPYLFVGFVPQSMILRGVIQGWKVGNTEYNFTSCDGNPNSYMTLLFNHNNRTYNSPGAGQNALMTAWYSLATEVVPENNIDDAFFTSFYEIHHGGCGGYLTGGSITDVAGVAIGVKFAITCFTPTAVQNGTLSLNGTTVGSVATYTCFPGLYIVDGDATRTCMGSGQWSGIDPVCRQLANVALGKKAYQTDDYCCGPGDAGLAVDGETSQFLSDGTCSLTQATSGAFWEVDLGDIYILHHVTVYGRLDSCCYDHLKGITLHTGLSQSSYLVKYELNASVANSTFTFYFEKKTYAKWVKIARTNGIDLALSLCEVQVLGYRPGSMLYTMKKNAIGTGPVLQEKYLSTMTPIHCCRTCFNTPGCVGTNLFQSSCHLLSSDAYSATSNTSVSFFLPSY